MSKSGKKIGLDEAVAKVKAATEGRIPAGGNLRESAGGGFSIAWELAWGVDARLNVDPRYAGGDYLLQVRVTWSSSSLTACAARVAGALHAQVSDLVCLLETVAQGLPTIVAGA